MSRPAFNRESLLAFVLPLGLSACAGPGATDQVPVGQAVAAEHEGDGEGGCLPTPADVPDTLKAPDDMCVKTKARGIGVQIYQCNAGVPGALIAPEANLRRHGRYVGNHFLGPTWQWRDGSKVHASKVAGVNKAGTIPWLLLKVTSEDGEGTLEDVLYVQRLHTSGGVAPATCTGTQVTSEYEADYVFYHPRPTDDDDGE